MAKAIHKWASHVAEVIPLVMTQDGKGRRAVSQFHRWPEVVRSVYGGNWSAYSVMEEDVEMLALDDIGAEYDPKHMGVQLLYSLLEKREKRWMVITTNILPSNWDEHFERRVSSRMLRNSEMVALDKVPDFSAWKLP